MAALKVKGEELARQEKDIEEKIEKISKGRDENEEVQKKLVNFEKKRDVAEN